MALLDKGMKRRDFLKASAAAAAATAAAACRLRAEHGHRHGRDRRQCQRDDPSGGQRCAIIEGARRVDAHPLPPELQPDVPEHGVCGGRRRGARRPTTPMPTASTVPSSAAACAGARCASRCTTPTASSTP